MGASLAQPVHLPAQKAGHAKGPKRSNFPDSSGRQRHRRASLVARTMRMENQTPFKPSKKANA